MMRGWRRRVDDDWRLRVIAASRSAPPGRRPVAEVLRDTTRWEYQIYAGRAEDYARRGSAYTGQAADEA